ncbi:MAG: VWA domain-containing protein [Planctomycetaceae bacterium]
MPRLRECATALAVIAVFALLARAMDPVKPSSDAAGSGTKVVTKDEALKKAAANAPRIELALLLDTSNSMDGLINQARAQLWKIVNDLATAEKDGKTPNLRVALYEYGNQGLPTDGGFVRQVLPLTDDLDKVSEQLFALSTNGGDEYCGRVIESATQGLAWSKSDEDLKIIVIAGNEPFTQGPVDYKKACAEAAAKGIMINTIHCGSREEGIATGWEDGAKLADGTYAHIDQNQQVVEIATPFDAELNKLSIQLNGTFHFYGTATVRQRLTTNQAAQDSNAAALGASISAERAATKAGGAYRFNSDLVKLYLADPQAVDELKEEDLPSDLQDKSSAERKKILDKSAAERQSLQKKINELAAKRDAYIAEARKTEVASPSAAPTLDAALLPALREQAEAKDFSFEK